MVVRVQATEVPFDWVNGGESDEDDHCDAEVRFEPIRIVCEALVDYSRVFQMHL